VHGCGVLSGVPAQGEVNRNRAQATNRVVRIDQVVRFGLVNRRRRNTTH